MTTTPTASPELPDLDLDELEALCAAAPRMWYGTLQIADGVTDDAAALLIEACSPDTVAELVRLARRAQPEGEAPQVDGIRGPLTYEQRDECRYLYNNLKHLQSGGYYVADDIIRKAAVYGYVNGRLDFAPAAQQAESGAQVAPTEAAIIELAKAYGFTFTRPLGSKSLELFSGNAQHHERFIGFAQACAALAAKAEAPHELKSTPVAGQKQPEVANNAAQQAAAPGALPNERALRDMFERDALTHLGIDHAISRTSFTRDDDGGYQYAATRRLFALWTAARAQAAPSAPGTPEAPAWTKQSVQALAETLAEASAKNAGVAPQLTFPHIYLGLMDVLLPRAAQLDGGQGEGDA